MASFLCGCWGGGANNPNEVVVYTALDDQYSRPIIEQFEKDTGIKVVFVTDSESNKTVGLRNRILGEKANPQCDVFWNNEIIHTIRLKQLGLLEAYKSPGAEGIPENYRDPEGYWTGFAARARVIVYNPEVINVEDVPKNLKDFADPKFKNIKLGLAKPLFGTTSAHMAVMYAKWGEDAFVDFLKAIKANGVRIVDGNATCMRMVGAGNLQAGFTDTDDASAGRAQGRPIEQIFHDQERDGTLVIPNTLALIRNCPHPENAKKLIDYLLTPDVERKLSKSESVQIPLHEGVEAPPAVMQISRYKMFEADFEKAAASVDRVSELVNEYLLND